MFHGAIEQQPPTFVCLTPGLGRASSDMLGRRDRRRRDAVLSEAREVGSKMAGAAGGMAIARIRTLKK